MFEYFFTNLSGATILKYFSTRLWFILNGLMTKSNIHPEALDAIIGAIFTLPPEFYHPASLPGVDLPFPKVVSFPSPQFPSV